MSASEMKYVEGLINKMKVIQKILPPSPPRLLGFGSRQQTLSSPGSSSGGASLFLKKRLTPTFLVLLAALVAGLLFLLPGGLLQAQNDGMIEYAENGTGAVATYTAVDPEGRMIYWSLLSTIPQPAPIVDGTALQDTDIEDADDFSISSDGVLSFNIPPDHESAVSGGTDADADNDNEYKIVVVASDGALGAGTDENPTQMGYKKVVVEVTDVDEGGMVTLPSRQPQVGVELTATLIDPEVAAAQRDEATWKWEKSQDMSSWTAIDGAGETATHTPGSTSESYYLRVTASYKDADGDDRPPAQAVSINRVQTAPTTTDAGAVFPDGSGARTINENSPAGANVGDPVAAMDTQDDVLTYSLGGTDEDSFDIDPATGQITVGPRTVLNEETKASYSVTVTAREASGDMGPPAEVTIMVRDVNEAPMVTAGVTMKEHMEDDADVDIDDTIVLDVSMYTATDPEGGTPTWELQGPDMDKLMIGTDGALTFKDAPNYEMPADAGRDNVYNVTVVATDDGMGVGEKMTAMRDVVIMVTNVAEDGTVTLSAQQPKIGVGLTAGVTDIDGGVTDITWKWERDDNRDNLDENADMEEVIEGATMATYTPTNDDNGQYLRAIATYTDGKGKDTAMKTSVAAVQVRTDNPPKFPDTEDGKRSIEEGMTGDVGASVLATDVETTQLLTYSLSGSDAGSFSISSDTINNGSTERGGQISVKSGVKLDHETKATYMVRVTATDPDNLSASIDVTIMVTDMNEAPEVTGDGEIEYAENGTRSLETFRATDPEGRMIYWSLLSTIPQPAPIVDGTALQDTDIEDADDFSISSDGVLSFNIPPDHESAVSGGTDADADNDNEYKIVVVASDGALGAGTDENPTQMGYKKVVVEVTDVDEGGMVTLPSRQPQVGVELTATLIDPEVATAQRDEATWKWEKSQDMSSWTAIDGAGETATHTPGSTSESYYLRVTASYKDADGDDRPPAQAVSINRVQTAPTTTDEDAVFPDGSDARTINENSPAGANVGDPVAAMDTQDDVLTYSLGGTDEDSFDIDPATGQITVGPRTVLNEETKASYSVTVTAREASGDMGPPAEVTIMVRDVNEAPMVTAGVTMKEHMEDDADVDIDDTIVLDVSMYTATDPEGGTPTWELQGPDMDKLMIGTDGALTFKDAPNYEMPADAGRDNVYNVTVVATDDGMGVGEKMTAMRDVVIMVTNVAEDGTVTLSAQQPKIGVGLTAGVTDIDGGVTDITWKWERDDNRDNLDENADMEEVIEGATMATYTPTNDDNGQYLRAIATYTDGKGKDTAMKTSVAAVQVRTDNPPKFPDTEDGKRSIEEGMTGDVGASVLATDVETTQLLTYSLSGSDAGSFSISSDTINNGSTERGGQISVKSGVKLDHETKATYMVRVTATDPGNLSASIDVTIMVTDRNEAPEIMQSGLAISGQSSIRYAENGTDEVATYTAYGPDAASATWSLSGADARDFSISATGGVLTFRSSPDYEAPADADTNNVYMVTVKAYDRTRIYMTERNVTVTVTDVDEGLAISGPSSTDYAENDTDEVATYTAYGPDAASATWSLSGADARDFSISGAGVLTFRSSPDYEAPADADTNNVYMVTVKAYDRTRTYMAELSVTVTVTDVVDDLVDDPGTVTLWVGTDALTGPAVVGEALTGLVVDSDGSVTGQSWQWMKAGSAAGQFTDITGATLASYTPVVADASMFIKVMATYTDAVGSGKTAESPSVMVQLEAAPMTLLERYDKNPQDGSIDLEEARVAVGDYFMSPRGSHLSLVKVREVVGLYFEYKNRSQ